MSNYLAIASVTETLRLMLEKQVTLVQFNAPVSVKTLPLDKASTAEGAFLNVFLYQVSPNAALRNADLPTRAGDRTLMQRSRAALDLHYILTAHGDDKLHEPQRLLGVAVRTLHSTPFLSRTLITEAIGNDPSIDGSDLADSPEAVKFTPVALSLDELSKLWSAFFQSKYALSAAYLASVIFVEGAEAPSSPLPVKSHKVVVVPSLGPVIERIASQATPADTVVDNQSILSTYTLHIIGRGLRGENTQVRIGEDLVTPLAPIHDDLVLLPLGTVAHLRAGVRTVQIVQSIDFKTPHEPHQGFESNAAAFMLAPRVTSATFTPLPKPSIAIDVTPQVIKGQRLVLILDESPPPATQRPLSLAFGGVAPVDSATPSIEVPGLASGKYLVRLRVDGAENPIDPVTPVTVSVPP
ncbi:MAG: hypothetical protein QOI24_1393 [Acidobacteriota bacterium]|nr:hypothetical protein [Acidobacteriota bacterium]